MLSTKVKVMSEKERQVVLMLDEMSIKRGLEFDIQQDVVDGYEDMGSYGRSDTVATHALVLMLRGLHYNWKQPIAYFLSSGTTKSSILKEIAVEAIRRMSD